VKREAQEREKRKKVKKAEPFESVLLDDDS
jgi:hypothetical protein